MPSTPRMIQIEAKASQPGEPLTQAEVTEWHRLNVISEWYAAGIDHLRKTYPADDIFRLAPNICASVFPDYSAAIRYLDSTGWRRPMNESPA